MSFIFTVYNGKSVMEVYSNRPGAIVGIRHRCTVINMNGTLVPIGQIYSFHSYV